MVEVKDIKVKPMGLIKDPKIVMLPDGVDHKNWIELGEKKKRRYKCTIISYAPNFGYLWRAGEITMTEAKKAEKGKKFKWFSNGLGGHGC